MARAVLRTARAWTPGTELPILDSEMSREHGESLANVDRDELHPLQIEALRKMSPARKMQILCAAIQMARDVRAAAVRAAHPEWSERQIQADVSRQILLASD